MLTIEEVIQKKSTTLKREFEEVREKAFYQGGMVPVNERGMFVFTRKIFLFNIVCSEEKQ